MRMTDSLILEVWHLSRPRTSALMVLVRAASSGLCRATQKTSISVLAVDRIDFTMFPN